MKVFIVLHHEIMGAPDALRADELLSHTCSSMKKALDIIKKTLADRWSWWEIKTQDLNSIEPPEHVGYYGLKGGKLAKPPYEKCVEIFKRDRHN